MNAAKRPVTTSFPYPSAQPLGSTLPRSLPCSQRLGNEKSSRQDFGRQNSDSSMALAASSAARNAPGKPKRIAYSGVRQAIAFESSVKLTVNLLLAIVAATTIAKLIPYYQSQQSRLTTLQASVEVAERNNAELRSQFNRNFDPAQASRIMQEQSGMSYPNQKKVIWQVSPESSSEGASQSVLQSSPEGASPTE
jgi:hypothetical protein